MPPWGRPPGGRRGRNRHESEREQRLWQQSGVFEELDSDDDDEDQGVYLGETLHFANADTVHRGHHRSQKHSEESGEESAEDDHGMQLTMREKEETLVQRAILRIRRAQELGRSDVQLSAQERDALERKIESDRAKGRKSMLAIGGGRKKVLENRRSSSKSSTRSRTSKKSARSSMTQLDQLPPNASGMMAPGPDGSYMMTPLSHLPPHLSGSSQAIQRPSSSHNLQHGSRRWISGGEVAPGNHGGHGSRPLPDDPNWQPRPRSYSSSVPMYPYPVDQYGYPLPFPAIPPQYLPNHAAASASDPAFQRQAYYRHRAAELTPSEESEISSRSSDEGEGVEVDVASHDNGRGQSAPASRRTSGHSAGTTSGATAVVVRGSGSRARRGKR